MTVLAVLLLALVVGCQTMPAEQSKAPAVPTSPPTLAATASLPEPSPTAVLAPLPTGVPALPTGVPALPTAPPPATDAPPLETLRLEPLWTEREFREPTNLVQLKDGRMLVTEQDGRIWAFDPRSGSVPAATEFLDITDRVSSRRSEEGLLGLALDPMDEQFMYVYYSASDPRRSVVSHFAISADESRVDPDSELVILEVEQPFANHNGGQISFGSDGYLYIGLGDGGSSGDPLGSGQDTSTLLGSILRIDASRTAPGQSYAIPPDNPFASGGGRGEIWAYGLRNPWRFSFDRVTGEMWTGDVGQNRWEEIDLIERGGNYGWNRLEGNHCFSARDCDPTGTVPPVWEYSLDGQPCSVIGGYVYRGSAIPWLRGVYVYGDFCSGEVFGLRYADGRVMEHGQLADTGRRIMSFGEDNYGELYLLSQKSGIYRLAD